MTAKEIVEYTYQHGKECFEFDSGWTKKGLEKAIKDYAKEKCIEQKKLCWDNSINGNREDIVDNRILDAPEPDFD